MNHRLLRVLIPIIIGPALAIQVAAQTPQITGVSPSQNELGVTAITSISIFFDIDMNAATITGSSFIANSISTGRHPGAITYDLASRTATLVPTAPFMPGDVITITVTTDVESAGGVALAGGYAWQFTIDVSGQVSGTFLPQAVYPVGDRPFCIFAADLDNDGDLDLTTANFNSHNLSVLLNNGDGSMAVHAVYSTGSNPWSISAADLDSDGDLDLATSNWGSDNVSVLLNNGDGTYASHITYPVAWRPHPIIAADLDGNGALDLIVGHHPFTPLSVLMNLGDGTFAPEVIYNAAGDCAGVCAADVDGDGDLDLVSAHQDTDKISVFLNYGDGTFAPFLEYPAGDGSRYVSAADLDSDGDLDLATANRFGHSVSVLSGDGQATFSAPTEYDVSGDTYTVIAADLDGDADLDLASVNVNSPTLSVLSNFGDGLFSQEQVYSIGQLPIWVVSADLDGNGHLDLATCNAATDNVSILLNDGLPPISAVVQSDLDTLYAFQAYAIVPETALVYLGNFGGGRPAGDVDPASIRLNGYVPDNAAILASHPGYVGQVWQLKVDLTRFILTFDPWYGITTQQFVVSASFPGGGSSTAVGEFVARGHMAGDVSNDNTVDILDLTFLVEYLFLGGPAPRILELGDIDGSGGPPDVVDLTALTDYLFFGGPPPSHP